MYGIVRGQVSRRELTPASVTRLFTCGICSALALLLVACGDTPATRSTAADAGAVPDPSYPVVERPDDGPAPEVEAPADDPERPELEDAGATAGNDAASAGDAPALAPDDAETLSQDDAGALQEDDEGGVDDGGGSDSAVAARTSANLLGCPPGLRSVLEGDFSGDWVARFGRGRYRPGFDGGSYAQQISFEGRTCLRVHYKKGTPGSDNGMFFKSPLEPGSHYALEFTFRMKPGFVYNHTGKLFGLNGRIGTGAPAGVRPNGRDKFNARMTWGGKGEVKAYVYHPEQKGGYGDTFAFGSIPAGPLHTIREELSLNTPGKHDGVLRTWLNGKPALTKTGMRFRDIDELEINFAAMDTFFGGGEPHQGPKRDEWIDFCYLRICGK